MKAEKEIVKGDCFNCESADLQPANIELAGKVKDQQFRVAMRGLRCPNCGYETIEGSDTPQFRKLLSEEYKKANKLLTAAELVELRSQLKMNQDQFAEFAGVGLASLKRWELGKIQERASDDRIRQRVRARFPNSERVAFYSLVNTVVGKGYDLLSSTLVIACQSRPTTPDIRRYIDNVAELCPHCKETAKIVDPFLYHPSTTVPAHLASLFLGRSHV